MKRKFLLAFTDVAIEDERCTLALVYNTHTEHVAFGGYAKWMDTIEIVTAEVFKANGARKIDELRYTQKNKCVREFSMNREKLLEVLEMLKKERVNVKEVRKIGRILS
jgi:hypothetical protein